MCTRHCQIFPEAERWIPSDALAVVQKAVSEAVASRDSSRLLKQVVNEAAGEKTLEAYPLGYVEDFFEPRTKLGACFSNRLKIADGALKDGNLRHRIA